MSSRIHYDHEDIATKRAAGWSWADIAVTIPGTSAKNVRQAHSTWRQRRDLESPTSAAPSRVGEDVSGEWNPSSGSLSGRSRKPMSLEDLMELSDLDPAEWEVLWARPGYSEVGAKDADGELVVERLFNLQARLRPTVSSRALEEVQRHVLESIRERSAARPLDPYYVENPAARPHMAELLLMDVHLGMLAWRMETGADFDLRIVEGIVRESVERLREEAAPQGVDYWLVPLGNDFYHTDVTIDGKGGATAAGTAQDVDGRWQKSFTLGYDLMRWAIDHLLEVAPVKILIVPGNHDETKAWFLGEVLRAHYHAEPHVRVDNRPTLRKYEAYGSTLLGFTHGHQEKTADLPKLMAHEAPEAWGGSRFREWHMGHYHQEKVQENMGVRSRFISPLTGTEAWHFKKGYVGNQREASVMMWTPDRGRRTTHHWPIIPDEEQVESLGPDLKWVGTPRLP